MRMQTCRQTELLHMLGVTTIGSHSHVGSQALGEDRHCLVDDVLVASLPKWSTKRLSTHQLSYASAGVYGTLPAWCPSCDSPVSSNLESLRATQSSQWTRSHSVVLHAAHTLRKWVGWNTCSISLSRSDKLQPNLAIKCKFDCLTVLWNFIQKSPRIPEISTKVVGDYVFMFTLYTVSYTHLTLPTIYSV